ncbi:MAG: anti-sigma factor antagonist [Solirubrobacteraceae bacterium]|jgi:anti-anti-sigma factor|nr:anti-sigma factor antagonist [Solirubrobacteraceae bacterium]
MHEASTLTLRTVERAGLSVIELAGVLELATVAALEAELDRLAEEGRSVVLDLRRVEFMDSSGLAVILRFGARAKDGPFDLVVVRGPRAVQRLFEMTGTDALLQMLDVGALDDLGPG